ncbi:MAG: winged helix-turn-helix domain-containing protein [Elusimicrobia bacterium]|nr:winged helix-turn-helix domain-containing protein [Elusimicrobiota bacterium]
MIAVTRDPAWAVRLDSIAARGGWPFAAVDALPAGRGRTVERAVVVLDRAAAGASLSRAVAALRALFPSARVILSCTDAELGAAGAGAGIASGADEVISKAWSDEKVAAKLGALRDAALASEVRVSVDGALKAELRSHRAYARVRGRWSELPMNAAEFSLLFSLLAAEGETVSRERLLAEMRRVAGREVESETVARRMLSLRRALAPWKGSVESVRGGFYRLASSRRRSTT